MIASRCCCCCSRFLFVSSSVANCHVSTCSQTNQNFYGTNPKNIWPIVILMEPVRRVEWMPRFTMTSQGTAGFRFSFWRVFALQMRSCARISDERTQLVLDQKWTPRTIRSHCDIDDAFRPRHSAVSIHVTRFIHVSNILQFLPSAPAIPGFIP